MYLIPIEAKISPIDGKGVFALQKIMKGEMVWKFNPEHDKDLSVEEFNNLDKEVQSNLKRVAYLSPTSNRYVYPPKDDLANFTNHSKNNNLSVVIDTKISEEPYFIANRNIEEGEELTNNYAEFDEDTKGDGGEWI